jgi:hypothetical protein
VKKPSPTKDAVRERKRDEKRATLAAWIAADQFMTVGIAAASLVIGIVAGWAAHGFVQ